MKRTMTLIATGLFLSVLSLVMGEVAFQTVRVFDGSNCTGNQVGFASLQTDTLACVSVNCTESNGLFTLTSCDSTEPTPPSGISGVLSRTFATVRDCSGFPNQA
jgi:hypothetical protein